MFLSKLVNKLKQLTASSIQQRTENIELDDMSSPEIKIEVGKYKPKWYVNFADFANMVKAFIGSNYLTVAFAFAQSGLLLGIGGMLVIAALTDHCCHLIVKTKHHAINKMLNKMSRGNGDEGATSTGRIQNYQSYDTAQDSGMDDDEGDDTPFLSRSTRSGDDADSDSDASSNEFHERIIRNMSYGDVGKMCYGSKGIGIVNFAIALTQFGFCVAYFIFIGNTVHSLFATEKCLLNPQNGTSRQCTLVYPNVSTQDLHMHGRSHKVVTDLHTDFTDLVSLPSLSSGPNTTTIKPSNLTTALPANITTTTTVPSNITTTPSNGTTTESPWVPMYELISKAPDLKILVACPLVVFILFSLIRNVRYLGVISVIANLSILFGCVSVFIFLIWHFRVHKSIVYCKIEGFPVFFGMVTSAFEGIGLVIPIESSMVGNRHLFTCFLHGAIGILSAILGCFGILGYLTFGEDVHQMLNTNISAGNFISVFVNVGICIGILLTFPLQMFPVIEICERYLFGEGRLCGPQKEVDQGEEETLFPSDNEPLVGEKVIAAHVPDSIPTWKRNIIRVTLVLVAAGFAILLKDNFAYVGAFVGAVGSTLLAYILPCLFHLKTCWHDVNVFIKMKDILIIIFGIFAGVISVISVIERISKNFAP